MGSGTSPAFHLCGVGSNPTSDRRQFNHFSWSQGSFCTIDAIKIILYAR